MACNNIDKCAAINFISADAIERVVTVGTGYSKISLAKRERMFLVSYPHSRSVSFFELPEARCLRIMDKDCDNLEMEIATECYPNSHVHPFLRKCVCNK